MAITKFVVNSKELLDAVKKVALATNRSLRGVNPSSMYIAFYAKGIGIEMRAFKDNFFIKKSIVPSLFYGDSVKFSLPSSLLVKALSSLREQPLSIEVMEYQVKVSHEHGEFYIPSELFHTEIEESVSRITNLCKNNCAVQMETPCLLSMVNKCKIAITIDYFRPVMNNMLIDFGTDGTNFVASDGHFLMMIRKKSVTSPKEGKVLIPIEILTVLQRILGSVGELWIDYTDEVVVINTSTGYTIGFKYYDGVYPNYMSVFPKEFNSSAVVERKMFIESIKRSILFAPQSSGIVAFNFSGDSVSINAKDFDENISSNEKMPIEHEGSDIRIGFCGSSLNKILSSLNTEKIKMKFVDPSRATIISPVSDDDREEVTALLMPMLLDD